MAKFTKNSGIVRQDAVTGMFRNDVRSTSRNSATAQAIRNGKKMAVVREQKKVQMEAKPRMSIKFLTTGK